MIDLVKCSAKNDAPCFENFNRRKHPRFKPMKMIYVFHCDFGKVLDISMGGLVFTYIYDKENSNEQIPEKGVLFFSCEDKDNYIDSMPFDTVSDLAVSKPNLKNSWSTRQRRISFGKLSENQTEKLERLILKHINIPQLAGTKMQHFPLKSVVGGES